MKNKSEKILKKIDSNRINHTNYKINIQSIIKKNYNRLSSNKIDKSFTPNIALINAQFMKINSDQNRKELGMTNRENIFSITQAVPLNKNMSTFNKSRQNLSTEKNETLVTQNQNHNYLKPKQEGKPRATYRDRAYTQYVNSNYSRFSKSSKILKTIGNSFAKPKRVYI